MLRIFYTNCRAAVLYVASSGCREGGVEISKLFACVAEFEWLWLCFVLWGWGTKVLHIKCMHRRLSYYICLGVERVNFIWRNLSLLCFVFIKKSVTNEFLHHSHQREPSYPTYLHVYSVTTRLHVSQRTLQHHWNLQLHFSWITIFFVL